MWWRLNFFVPKDVNVGKFSPDLTASHTMLEEHLTSCLITVNTGRWKKILLPACLNFSSFGLVYVTTQCVCVCVYRSPPQSPTLPPLWLSTQPQPWVTLPLIHTDWTTCTDPSLRYTYIHTYIHTRFRDVRRRSSTCRHAPQFIIVSNEYHFLSTAFVLPLVQVDGALATLIRLTVR